MADRRAQYHTNGAAAYDVYAWNQSTAPQRRPEPQHLPEERPLPQKRQRVKARTALAPFTVVGMLAVACLLVLVVFGYVQLFEATSEVSTVNVNVFAKTLPIARPSPSDDIAVRIASATVGTATNWKQRV